MEAANRASKRRRTSKETQKFHGEPKEGDEEEHQEEEERVADGNSAPLTIGLSDDVGRNKSPVVVFAHGAGAPSSSDWMMRSHSLHLQSVSICVHMHLFLILIRDFFADGRRCCSTR